MFTQIKTSKANKMIVTDLSRKFNLGAENTIARIAIAYSLSKGEKKERNIVKMCYSVQTIHFTLVSYA